MNMTVDTTAANLQLKRWFLRVLVISLTTCALVAVAALLAGQFNRTTGRILLTLGALAVHSGVAMACSASIERQRLVVLSRFGLFVFGVNLCVLLLCFWLPNSLDWTWERAILGTGALAGYFVLAIPFAGLLERRYRQALSLAGLTACAVGLVMVLVCIWAEPTGNMAFARATGVVGVIAFSLAHVCVLMRVPGRSAATRLLWGTIVCIAAVGVMWSVAIIYEPRDELFYRVLGAVGVLDASGTLLLLIVSKLRQLGKIAGLQSTSARIAFACPRCTESLEVPAGKSNCGSCGLKIALEIEEPRCAKCDYLLWQLPNRRCPECGTPF